MAGPTPPCVIELPRPLSSRIIAGAVRLAVDLGNRGRQQSTVYIQRFEPGRTLFMLGQNSCLTPARLHVRPEGGSLFQVDRAYDRLEVAWCGSWPRLVCTHHHSGLTRAQAISKLATNIQRTIPRVRS